MVPSPEGSECKNPRDPRDSGPFFVIVFFYQKYFLKFLQPCFLVPSPEGSERQNPRDPRDSGPFFLIVFLPYRNH